MPRQPSATQQLMAMSEFRDFLDAVPDTDRKQLAEMLRKHDLTTFDGFITFSKDVMVAVLAGEVPPPVADAAARWGEMAFTAICVASDKYNVSPKETQLNILNILAQARDAKPALPPPTYDAIEAERPRVALEATKQTG